MTHRFLVDGMLGSLARWLRICGYDTEYRRDADDNLLIEDAMSSGRILLTKDRLLSRNARKRNVISIQVKGANDVQKLGYVASKLDLDLKVSDKRCPKCNGQVHQAEKDTVKDTVPKNSYNAFEEFWICEDCQAVYWRGGHWENILKTIEMARETAKNSSFQ
jgi:uncharacterized protein with PIN domain